MAVLLKMSTGFRLACCTFYKQCISLRFFSLEGQSAALPCCFFSRLKATWSGLRTESSAVVSPLLRPSLPGDVGSRIYVNMDLFMEHNTLRLDYLQTRRRYHSTYRHSRTSHALLPLCFVSVPIGPHRQQVALLHHHCSAVTLSQW